MAIEFQSSYEQQFKTYVKLIKVIDLKALELFWEMLKYSLVDPFNVAVSKAQVNCDRQYVLNIRAWSLGATYFGFNNFSFI